MTAKMMLCTGVAADIFIIHETRFLAGLAALSNILLLKAISFFFLNMFDQFVLPFQEAFKITRELAARLQIEQESYEATKQNAA